MGWFDSACTTGLRLAGAAAATMLFASASMAQTGDVARGKYLATIGICASCHTKSDEKGFKIESMRFAGGEKTSNLFSANLTPDPETGLGKWTEAQIVEAIRNGKRPDGQPVRPNMGVFFYRGLSDHDAFSIAAYLKSLTPIRNPIERLPKPPAEYARVESVPEPDRTNKLAYGEYIAKTVAHCLQCHTPRAPDGLPDLAKAGAGGNTYAVAGGGTAMSANITPGNPNGVAKWTDDQFKAAITKGVRPDGSKLIPVMDFDMYAALTPDDLDAMVVYLRTLKPVVQ